jgi:hypothetical protein
MTSSFKPTPRSVPPPQGFPFGMQWYDAVERLAYVPGSFIYITGYFEGDLVAVTFDLPCIDSYHHHERRITFIETYLSGYALAPGVLRMIRNSLVEFAKHEVDENFTFKGIKVYDPHSERRLPDVHLY